MSSFYDFLAQIRQKPGLFLGAPSVTNLQSFLWGYNFSRREQGIVLTAEEKEFEQFPRWMRERFKVTGSVAWPRIILLYAADERDGFDYFFRLFDEFIQSQKAE